MTAFYDYYHGPNTISFYHGDILLLFTFDPTDPFRILLPSCHGTSPCIPINIHKVAGGPGRPDRQLNDEAFVIASNVVYLHPSAREVSRITEP